MRVSRKLVAVSIFLLFIVATAFLVKKSYLRTDRMNKIHILQAPLSIGSEKDNNYYLLPKGTYLYFDTVFPEGFTRYKIYLNIKENFELHDNTSGVEAPISADSISKPSLLNILKNVKLDKDDIKAILANGKFSDGDKKEIAEFIQRGSN
jgi:hypothetical protein